MFEYVILIYTCIIFLSGMYTPLPYGRYCTVWDLPLKINNRVAWVFANIFALIALVIQVIITPPKCTLASVIFAFLCVHFVWRSIISQVWIGLLYEEKKETSFLISLFLASYNIFVGIMFGQMIHSINEEFELYHLLFITGCTCALILNGYYDVWVNTNREVLGKITNDKDGKYLGYYISLNTLQEYYEMMLKFHIIAPNYFFEILEWVSFFLLTLHTEALIYLIATALLLMIRTGQLSVWYRYLK
jgi:hypothetical protein